MLPASCTRKAAIALAAILLAGAGARGAGEIVPGAYCPIPQPNQKPDCLEPARAHYGGFIDEVAGGAPSDAAVSGLEADLARGAASERSYLALSTLAYGYYHLARLAAASPGGDPGVVTRLERWNALLSHAYASSEDPTWRGAVRAAALDVRERSPAIQLRCQDAVGQSAGCTTTEAVLRGFDEMGGEIGVRGSLHRILKRAAGESGD